MDSTATDGDWPQCQWVVMIIATSKDAADLLQPFFQAAALEKVVTLYLDAEKRLIKMRESEPGTRLEADLPIREIIAEALQIEAAALIVAHNHPSGNPSPSVEDIRVTRQLAATAEVLGIKLYDHLIFATEGERRSLRALGLL